MEDYKKLNELQRLLYRQLYKKDFYEFTKAFWECADPAPLIDGILIQIYCEIFQYLCRWWIPYEKKEITLPPLTDDVNIINITENPNIHNCNINIPPSHSKSMVLNVLAGCWIWINQPLQVASISHTGDLALTMNKKRQSLLNSEKFKFFFPEIELVTNTTYSLEDSRGGELYSINRNAMTGYHASIIINDDITNARVANRDKQENQNAWDYFRDTMPSRVSDPSKCVILNIQQRLAPNDITGHILSDAKLSNQYCFVTLPAIFEKKTYVVLPISGKVVCFEEGQPLWKERFGDYQGLREQVGESVFQTQYMQKPVATDRTVIKDEMIIEKDICDVPDISQADMVYASHDFPVKDKDTSDFLGSILAYRIGSTLYIKDCLEKKMAFVASVEYVKNLDNVYHGCIQIIEDKANGSPIIQQVSDEVAGVQAFQPGTQSKMQRLESASLYLNAGNVIFVRSKFDVLTSTYKLTESLTNLKNRLLAFPFVEHDDIVDAFSQLCLFVFMDRRYMVYGRSFTELNIVNTKEQEYNYSTCFFNKEGDIWKVLDIGVQYGLHTKLIVLREIMFKASLTDGLSKLKEFAPDKNVFIDSSATDALTGIYTKDVIVEKYSEEDFDKSVSQLNLAFANKLILIDESCKLLKADIDNFKYDKTKEGQAKFKTQKDGYVACIRSAMKYYGGIN